MIFFLFFLLFAPYFIVLDYQIPSGHIVYLSILLIYFLTQKKHVITVPNEPIFFAICVFSAVCAILILFNSIKRGDIDLKLLRLILDPFIIYFASRYVFLAYKSDFGSDGFAKLIMSLSALNFLNAFVIYMSFASEIFRSNFYSVVQVNPKVFEYPVPRYSGFLYDGFSYSSTLMSLITITCYILYLKSRVASPSSILLLHILTIPASLLAGRMGVIILSVYFLFMFLVRFFSFLNAPFFSQKKFIFISIFVIFFIALTVKIYGISGPFGEHFKYSLRFITNIFNGGNFNDSTAIELVSNHYFLPGDISTLLIGGGYLIDWPLGTSRPDPAVTLAIFAFGLVGFILYLGVLISPLFNIIKRRIMIRGLPAQYVGLIFVFFLLLFKDAYIFYPYPHFFLFFLCAFTISIPNFNQNLRGMVNRS